MLKEHIFWFALKHLNLYIKNTFTGDIVNNKKTSHKGKFLFTVLFWHLFY